MNTGDDLLFHALGEGGKKVGLVFQIFERVVFGFRFGDEGLLLHVLAFDERDFGRLILRHQSGGVHAQKNKNQQGMQTQTKYEALKTAVHVLWYSNFGA